MRLTMHTDYALRVLMFLALEPDEVHAIPAMAQRYGISRNHLMKVGLTLIQNGFVESVRGRNGGLKLARSPREIKLSEIVRATEDNFAIVECFDRSNNNCLVTPACGLRVPLQDALSAFMAVLDRYTLADAIQPSGRANRMRRLLNAIG